MGALVVTLFSPNPSCYTYLMRARGHAIHLSLAPEYQVPVNLNISYSEFGITNSWDQRSEATCALRHIRTTEGRMV